MTNSPVHRSPILKKYWTARRSTGRTSFWIFLRAGQKQPRRDCRWSWPSINTYYPGYGECGNIWKDWEAELVREVPGKLKLKRIAGLFVIRSPCSGKN